MPGLGEPELELREAQLPLGPGEAEAVGAVLVDPEGERPVPEVRLERVEVDQALSGADPPEGSSEVPVVALEVLEDRVVAAELPGDRTAGGPVAPAPPERVLEASPRGRLEGGRAGDEALQGAADVAPDEVEGDPPLSMPQVPEALLVEVVREPVLPDGFERGSDAVAVRPAEVADDDPELVPQGRAGVERRGGPAHRLDPQVALLHADGRATLEAHVLGRHALPVLQPGHADVSRGDPHEVRELRRGLHGRQLLLPNAVEPVRAGRLEDLGEEALGDLEICGADLELHGSDQRRGGRTLRSCLRTRSRSRGTGAVTRSGSSRSPRGGRVTSWAWRVRRSMSGRSGRPRLGR